MPAIKQYQQQTSPSGIGMQPQARGPQLDDAGAVALQRMGGAAMGAAVDIHRANEAAEQRRELEEAEDAKLWTAKTTAEAQAAMMQAFIDQQDTTESGAADFTKKFGDTFDKYSEDVIGKAPNDVSRKFLAESFMRLRADMTGKAMEYEIGERRKWRVETASAAIDTVAANLASDPSRLPVVLAEQRSVIDAMLVPPDVKRAMKTRLDEQVSTAVVLGEIERDPIMARAKLADRLGVHVEEVSGPQGPAPDAATVQGKLDAIGKSFNFDTTSTTRTKAENADVGGVPNSQHLTGTARDYSIKGKTAEEISGMVAALRAEGFEAGVHTKGTAPHIHAELPPRRERGPTVAEATTAKPEGEKTGDPAYDLLTIPQVVAMLGRTETAVNQQQAQYQSLIAAREADDLAAYGDGKQPPQPITAGEFVQAYGGTEGARRWASYQHAKVYASEVAGLAGKTDAEIVATIEARTPVPGDNYAAAARTHAALTQAAQAVVTQRRADPIAYAMENKLADVAPLDFTNADAMGAELKRRVGVASTMTSKYGTPYTLLTAGEAKQMAGTLGQMTAPEKATFLAGIRGSLPDPRAYQSIMAVLRPDSPVTATAGSILAVGTARQGLDPMAVSTRLLQGEDLLNPAKGDKAGDGKPKFPMPSDTDLRATWNAYTASAYAGSPDTEAASYQAFRAYYAAELASTGDYSGTFNPEVAERAAAAVTGGVVEVNDSSIVLPWGQGERFVVDQLRRGWESQRTGAGYGGIPFEQIGLLTVGDGLYQVTAGTGPVRGADGKPMLLRIERLVGSEMPQVPTGP